MSDVDIDLSRSLKVKSDSSILGLTIYGFILMFNNIISPNSAPLRDISFQNMTGLDINLSASLRSNVVASMDPSYPFLLMFHSNIRPT